MFHCQYLLFRQIAELEVKMASSRKVVYTLTSKSFFETLGIIDFHTIQNWPDWAIFESFWQQIFFKSSPNICFLVLTVWPFRKLLATHFLTIVAQIFAEFMGQCKSSTFLVKRNVTDLVVTFGKTAKFLFHHLVSLLIHNIFANICRTYWQ